MSNTMIELKPSFNTQEFEVYGLSNPYLTPDQNDSLNSMEDRVNGQLDWLAQLLGWNGPDYWTNLASNISQKRSLLSGTFGVYNSFLYPEIKEIRNWDNTVVIKADDRIQVGQIFYLGDYSYELLGLTSNGDNYILDFGVLTDEFLGDIASNQQLKVNANLARPLPFSRPGPLNSADINLNVSLNEAEGSLDLTYITGKDTVLPLVNLAFFQNSRLYLDAPAYLSVTDRDGLLVSTVDPVYSFDDQKWYLEIPQVSSALSTSLVLKDCQTPVKTEKWSFDGKWGDLDILQSYSGVWGNKGGKLPFHFIFDSLGLHGCDPEKSVSMETLESSLPFNVLLDLVYYQQARISQQPPSPQASRHQVWWNEVTGALSVYQGGSFNCGPWVEVEYPVPPKGPNPFDYLFEDVNAFRGYTQEFEKDSVIKLLNGNGLGVSDSIKGLTGTISGPCEVSLLLDGKSNLLIMLGLEFEDVASFNANVDYLPGKVPIKVKDSAGLSPNTNNYSIGNLSVTLTESYPILLSRDAAPGVKEWFISPPSNLKYIGNTSLFDNGDLMDGQLFWDFSEPDINLRSASIFYYNRWEEEGGEWVLKGDWAQLNQTEGPSEINPTVNYGVIQVYCDGEKLEQGEPYSKGDFILTYTADQGEFTFTYSPLTFNGICQTPMITISDSLTTAFKYDITDFVFSGAAFKFNPNPLDANTPLRLWKTEPLLVVDSQSDLNRSLTPNALVADGNLGPSDPNWERYFIRLSPLFERDGSKWQKVNLVCQNFGLWGSPLTYENMVGPKQEESVSIYEESVLFDLGHGNQGYLYSEPFLYSNIKYEEDSKEDYENSSVIPGIENPGDGFIEALIEEYDPLHYRQIKLDRESKDYGSWVGKYVRKSDCSTVGGEIVNDLETGAVREITPPLWDSSIYKMPSAMNESFNPTQVDSNHYKICYAFFVADMSSAEDPCFVIG